MNTRVSEVIEFHRYCCWNDSIVMQLKAYADVRGLNVEQREWLVLFYGLSYCVPTAIVCLEHLPEILRNPEAFWRKYKDRLIFQSDRRWVKFNDRFAPSFVDFVKKGILRQLRGSGAVDLERALGLIQSVSYFARFAAFLTLEAYCFMFQRPTINDSLDWKHGDTATSGMLNVLCLDNEANEFDRTGVLTQSVKMLDHALQYIQSKIPPQDGRSVLFVETNLCAYRKLFKGTRYVGYYVDRVQGELELMLRNFPEHRAELNALFDARAAAMPVHTLGELNGWHGIRKHLCKHYIQTGRWLVG